MNMIKTNRIQPQLRVIVAIAVLAFCCNAFVPTAYRTHHVVPNGFARDSNVAVQLSSNANNLMPLQPGSSVALITPFDKDTGKISTRQLQNLLQYHIDAGTNNLCILGTTSESAVMTMDERQLVLDTTVNMCKGKIPIMVGTGTINPQNVKAMTLQAMDAGADASLVVTPYYVKPPQRALVRHYLDAANYGLPVCIYNVPGRTGVDIKDETIIQALISDSSNNIVAVKDATGDLSRITNLRQLLNDNSNEINRDILIYSGDDGTTLDFVGLGGDGTISVTANIAAKQMVDMVAAALSKDTDTAKAINDKLDILHNKLFCECNPIPTKYAAMKLGLIESSYCRPPLDTLDPAMESVVDDALKQAGLM